MTEIQVELLAPLINEYSVLKSRKETEQATNYLNLIHNFNKVDSINNKEKIQLNDTIIKDYLFAKENLNELNKRKSVLFNPLKFFPIGETMHSYLIANLISPDSTHGQGNLFLKSFLKLLDIEVFEKDNWIVTSETGRVDVLLRRQHPHAVVIIENKSNYACDQENQLYRYWFQEIYLPNEKMFGNKTVEMTSNNNNYQIIYLTPAVWKLPSDNSLTKPQSGYDIKLPEKIPIQPKIWLFNHEIVLWLEGVSQQIHKDNHRLKEYIKQYIELWT